jgi:hypothetical protein
VRYHDCDSGERGEIVSDERGTYCDECGVEFELRPQFEIEDAETFASVDEPGADPLVVSEGGCVIPVGGFVLVYGDAGTGKTTLCLDWAVHFVTASDWLGLLEPARPLTVLLVENEGPRPEFRRKLRRRIDAWNELEGPLGRALGGRLRVLREPWGSLTLRSPAHREELAGKLVDVDLVIGGPLSALGTEGGGTLDEIREFESFMQTTRELANHPVGFVLVHHENRAGQVSGAWERAPDALVHVQAEGHGRVRLHWQKVKWCSSLHKTTTQLAWADGDTFTVAEREEITEDTMAEGLLEAVRLLPGGSWTKLRELRHDDGKKVIRGKGEDAAGVRDRLILEGVLLNTAAVEGQFNLWAADDPAAPRSDAGTGWERASSPSPAREPVDVPVPRSALIGNGVRERTGLPGSDSALMAPLAQLTGRCPVCDVDKSVRVVAGVSYFGCGHLMVEATS